MHIPNNPQLNMYHHTLQERQRLLQKHRLESYHASLHRREKEIMEDYHRRVEKMKEVSVTPTTPSEIRKSIDILC